MGSYTEFCFKATLKEDTPKSVIDLLVKVVANRDLGHDKQLFHTEDVFIPEINHPFFKCERWYMCLISNNWDDEKYSKFYKNGKFWRLEIDTEFKNYDSEITHFLNWIQPYIIGRKQKKYVGWRKGEWEQDRNHIHLINAK